MIQEAWRFVRKYFWIILPVLIIILGLFLRTYNIRNTYFFEGELGKELLYMRQFALAHTLPLVGMPTSHEWLSYGPFYYWIMIPLFNLFHGSPFILFWSAVTVSLCGLIINYFVIHKIADRKAAVFSTLIQAVSPLLIWHTKLSKLHSFFFILIPVFMYLTYLIWEGKKKWVLPAGLVFGLMFSFHFSQIPLLGVIVLMFWIKKHIYKWKDWLRFALGVLIPNITYIWRDWKIAAWLPYRTLNLAEKNPSGTLQALKEYFGNTLFWDNRFWVFGLAIFVAVFTYYIYTNRQKLTKEFLPFFLVSSIGFVLVANIIHGASPIHYFLPVFTIVPILYAVYLTKTRWGIYILLLLFGLNFTGYFSFTKPAAYVPLYKQTAIADFIITDSKGRDFSLKRVGPYDYFPENYSQGYKYLILWKGGKLIENSGNLYNIFENGEDVHVHK